ncbi:fimbria/pilus periplasmic chaperone [Sphingobium sp. Sx8-8]|uniref:fimbrial biogenesis chaperone n=1 Tax=Sphingobium sp. Sx8-8 TaxID=2933617 RepID=UPI001F599877|nr:fimbria/pilus periplasmic chaperone [Sphingobium sp. Sx8-8]
MTGKSYGAWSGWGLAVRGLCALLTAVTAPADAAALRILPVRIEMVAERQFCAFSIANDDAAATTVQIRGFGWRKDSAGNDELDPETGPMVNPSIVSIAGGESRLIRCSLPAKAGSREESYRLVIDELPTSAAEPGTVRTLLRVSIPLFRVQSGASPQLRWSLGKGADGPLLMLANQGDRHIQAVGVNLRLANGSAQAVKLDRGFYLLADGQIMLPVGPLDGSSIAGVDVQTTQGKLAASRAGSER